MLTLHSPPPKCSILMAVSASQSLQMNFHMTFSNADVRGWPGCCCSLVLFLVVIVDASKCLTIILTHISSLSVEASNFQLNKDEATDTSEGWPVTLLSSVLNCNMINVHCHLGWNLFDCSSSTLFSVFYLYFNLECSVLTPRRRSHRLKEFGGCVTVVSCQFTRGLAYAEFSFHFIPRHTRGRIKNITKGLLCKCHTKRRTNSVM